MVFTAEFTLSWATGSGLLICCITGLAVTDVGRGSECRAPEEDSLPTFWEQLLDFLHTGFVDRRANRQTDFVYFFRGKKTKKPQKTLI